MNMSVSPKSLKSAKRLVEGKLGAARPVTKKSGRGTTKRKRGKSFYELYPMPFFNSAAGKTWDVKPTGDYAKDCDTGTSYAIQFLRSCDGTIGWGAAFSWTIHGLMASGPDGFYPDGGPKINGIVVGFTATVGKFLAATLSPHAKGAAPSDPAIAAVTRLRDSDAAFLQACQNLDNAELKAHEQHGHRPIALVTWRNYHIGGSELETRREALLQEGLNPELVEEEYRKAKKREREIEQAGRQWDRRAGVVQLRKALERIKQADREARAALANIKPTTPAGAGAIIAYINAELTHNETAEWHQDALNSAATALAKMNCR